MLIALVRRGRSLCISSSARPGAGGLGCWGLMGGRWWQVWLSRQDTFEERLAEILEQKQQLSDFVMFDCHLADPVLGLTWKFIGKKGHMF